MKTENILISSWKHCDIFGKIDIVILILLSLYSWYLMIEKYLIIKNSHKNNQIFLNSIRQKKPIEILSCPLYRILKELIFLIKTGKTSLGKVKGYFEKLLLKEKTELEKNLSHLATITAIAPFLGLLGTVWGLLIAFTNMAITGSSSIRVVASGVAEALITTVIGLLVAIPAAVGYNFLKEKVFLVIEEMELLGEEIEEFLMYIDKNEK